MLTSLIFSISTLKKVVAVSVSRLEPVIGPVMSPKINTAIIGPAETIATAPKLSSLVAPLLTEHMPITRDNKNGAVIVPVATLPASKDKPKYSFGAKIASIKIIAYKTSKQYFKGTFFNTLKSAKETKSPAPIPNKDKISQVERKELNEVI